MEKQCNLVQMQILELMTLKIKMWIVKLCLIVMKAHLEWVLCQNQKVWNLFKLLFLFTVWKTSLFQNKLSHHQRSNLWQSFESKVTVNAHFNCWLFVFADCKGNVNVSNSNFHGVLRNLTPMEHLYWITKIRNIMNLIIE